jgi:hypothetical protein
MSFLDQIDELLSYQAERALEKQRACRGARLLTPMGRATVEGILFKRASDVKPVAERRPDGGTPRDVGSGEQPHAGDRVDGARVERVENDPGYGNLGGPVRVDREGAPSYRLPRIGETGGFADERPRRR